MVKFNLTDGYKFKGFIAKQKILGFESDPNARIVQLKRIQKKLCVNLVIKNTEHIMIKK